MIIMLLGMLGCSEPYTAYTYCDAYYRAACGCGDDQSLSQGCARSEIDDYISNSWCRQESDEEMDRIDNAYHQCLLEEYSETCAEYEAEALCCEENPKAALCETEE
tara:strand:- start:385 stop:702 length:318 start_codon:yes stop_codon:yes gene_type:complete